MDMGLLIVFGILVALILWAIVTYNGLVSIRNQVQNAWGQIDVQLKRRHDLIPNLVEVVKDYMDYEQETLRQVIDARNQAASATGPDAAIPAEAALTGAVTKLFGLMENYPDLKADQNVSNLMEELASTENKIAFARQFYNDSVMNNNNKVQSFPANMIAGAFNFSAAQFFDVPESETATPKVDLR